MKRYLRLAAVLLAVLLLLAGCGKEAEPQPTEVVPQQLGPLSLGDVMPDLTFTTAKGESIALSALLQEKKVVVLNFWYADCGWCVREFPVLEVAYQRYRDSAEVVALSPYDAPEDIATFQKDHSLSFPMGSCARDLTLAFGINAYPTSVVIDRDGVICMITKGAITDVNVFNKLFDTFTAEDYSRKIYHSINDIL